MVLIQGLRNPLQVRVPRPRAGNPLEGNGHQGIMTPGLVLLSPSPTASSADHQTSHLTQGVRIPGPDRGLINSGSAPRLPPTWRASTVICSVSNGTEATSNKTTDTAAQSHHCSGPAQQTLPVPGGETRLEKMGGGVARTQENRKLLVAAEGSSKTFPFCPLSCTHWINFSTH